MVSKTKKAKNRHYNIINEVILSFGSRLDTGVFSREIIERIHARDSRFNVYSIWDNLQHFIKNNTQDLEFLLSMPDNITINGDFLFIASPRSCIWKYKPFSLCIKSIN